MNIISPSWIWQTDIIHYNKLSIPDIVSESPLVTFMTLIPKPFKGCLEVIASCQTAIAVVTLDLVQGVFVRGLRISNIIKQTCNLHFYEFV